MPRRVSKQCAVATVAGARATPSASAVRIFLRISVTSKFESSECIGWTAQPAKGLEQHASQRWWGNAVRNK